MSTTKKVEWPLNQLIRDSGEERGWDRSRTQDIKVNPENWEGEEGEFSVNCGQRGDIFCSYHKYQGQHQQVGDIVS